MLENLCPNRIRTEMAKSNNRNSLENEPARKKQKTNTSEITTEKLVWNGKELSEVATIAGKIMKVEIENFMCFKEHTEVLNPFVNFISGKNGAGKSTFAKAIAIGLGSTGVCYRMKRKLETLISTECRSAKIRIHVNNQGRNSYKKKIYGNAVIVERKITRNSNDGYKLISADESFEASGKKTLLDALRVWKIEMDNPIFYLDQDESKLFFNNNKSKDLYQFFYRGSGLNEAEERYEIAKKEAEEHRNLLNQKKREFRKEKKELEQWKKNRETAHDEDDLLAANDQMQLWRYKTLCEELAPLENFLNEAQNKLEERLTRLRALDISSIPRTPTSHRTGNDEARLRKLESERKKKQIRSRQIPKNLHQLKEERDNLDRRWQIVESDVRRSDFSVNVEERATFIASQTATQHGVLKDLENAKKERDKLAAAVAELGNQVEEQAEIRDEIERLKMEKNTLNRDLENVKNSSTSWKTALAEETALVRACLPNSVAGPIANHISLQSSQHHVPVDQAVAPFLSTYFMEQDFKKLKLREELENIRKSCKNDDVDCPDVAFIEGERNSHIFQVQNVTENHEVLANTVSFDNPLAKKFISVAARLPQSIIIDDPSDALNFMENSAFLVEKVYDSIGYSYESKDDLIVISPPVSRSYVLSSADQTKQLRDIKKKLRSTDKALEEHEQRLGSLVEAEEKLEELQNQFRQANASVSLRQRHFDLVSEELEKMASQQKAFDESMTIRPKIIEIDQQILVIKQEQTSLPLEMERMDHQISQIQDRMQAEASQIAEANANARKAAPLKKEIEKLRKDIALMEQTVSTARQEQQIIMQRLANRGIDANEEPEEDEAVTRQKYELFNQQNVSHAVKNSAFSVIFCDENIAEKEQNLKRVAKEIGQCEELATNADRNSIAQENKWKPSIELVAMRMSDSCRQILMERNLEASITFDHSKKQMQYLVRPKDSAATFGHLESLSGGERAFALIAFLISLWRNDAPFRILDEFECFMDSNNRKDSIKFLTAKACDERIQCLFLSPTAFNIDEILSDASVPQNMIQKIMIKR